MICKKCQKEIDNDSKFCEFCGSGIRVDSVTSTPIPEDNGRVQISELFKKTYMEIYGTKAPELNTLEEEKIVPLATSKNKSKFTHLFTKEGSETVKLLRLELILSGAAIALFIFAILFLDSSLTYPISPWSNEGMLASSAGHNKPVLNEGYRSFYSFLRIFIFTISSYFIFINYRNRKMMMVFVFLIIGVIFNPILPLSLDVNSWRTTDFFSSLFFAYYMFLTYKLCKNIN